MARLTTNYGFNISEGNDPVNPLVDIFPNWDAIDSDLKDVSDASVGTATELTTGTVHALSRSDTDKNVFVFIATSNYTAGDTFVLDGNQVSALTPDGQALASGSYVIGATVLCALHDTLITVYVSPAKAKDADMLDGHDSTYYAKDSDLDTLGNTVNSISDKVGSAVLSTTAPDLSGAVNELDTDLSDLVGLVRNVSQPAGNNLNNIEELGTYGIGFYTFDANTGNTPANTNGVCLTFRINTTYAVQLALLTTGTSVFIRNKVNTWSTWRVI